MQLVILAAGFGRRFGGLKQLAPVGPQGQAIMDYTASAAQSCGYESIIVVIREEIREEIESHIAKNWPSDLKVHFAVQGPVAGTAQAVLSAAPYIHGPFGVCNADDLYGKTAFLALREHFEPVLVGYSTPAAARGHHLLVAYHVLRTVLTDATVTRGICEVDGSDNLRSIAEHHVSLREDGRFDAEPLVASAKYPARILEGSEWVSMNLWGFYPSMLDHLADAVANFETTPTGRRELLLPEVVSRVINAGAEIVHVIETDERCIGITHAEDISIVNDELSLTPDPRESLLDAAAKGRTRS
jgi:choline kinase